MLQPLKHTLPTTFVFYLDTQKIFVHCLHKDVIFEKK